MMDNLRLLLTLGLILMLLGVILPFLMVIHLIESTFFLNFFAWGASVSGVFLGFIGVATWSKMKQ